MPGVLYQYLADDHERLDSLFRRAVAKPGEIEAESYHEFRKGLLRHIAMEEKNRITFHRQVAGRQEGNHSGEAST